MGRLATYALLLPAAILLGGAGCFNDAFRGHEFRGDGGITRFELQIQADRTEVDATHFLVDRATGDVWRLAVSDGTRGTWVRLADGPSDVAALDFGSDAEPEEEAAED